MKPTVAEFITNCIESGDQRQKDIASKVGFDKPNMITMIKQGKSRLPLDKIGLMALALQIDPVYLFHLCMSEYQPETWKVIAPLLETALTHDEKELIFALRHKHGGPYLKSGSAGSS